MIKEPNVDRWQKTRLSIQTGLRHRATEYDSLGHPIIITEYLVGYTKNFRLHLLYYLPINPSNFLFLSVFNAQQAKLAGQRLVTELGDKGGRDGETNSTGQRLRRHPGG